MKIYYSVSFPLLRVILYEDLVATPQKEVASLLDFVGADTVHTDFVLEALNRDSQNDANKGSKEKAFRLGREHERQANEIFDIFGTGLRLDMTVEEFRDAVKL